MNPERTHPNWFTITIMTKLIAYYNSVKRLT